MPVQSVRYVPLAFIGMLGAFVACSSSGSGGGGLKVAESRNPASVIIAMAANDQGSGSCSGTVIAPTVVLTAGHCVAGKAAWTVTAPNASNQVATATSGHTYDWEDWQSNRSHPTKNDLGVIVLDTPIQLSSYPTVATAALDDGATVVRIRRSAGAVGFGDTVQEVSVGAYSGKAVGFPNFYYTAVDHGEAVDTGGAVLDPSTNTVHGVVSAVGDKSQFMYVSRTDGVAPWVQQHVACAHAGGAIPLPPGKCYGACGGGKGGKGGKGGATGGAPGADGGAGAPVPAGPASDGGAPGADGGPSGDNGGACGGGVLGGILGGGKGGGKGGKGGGKGGGAGGGTTCGAGGDTSTGSAGGNAGGAPSTGTSGGGYGGPGDTSGGSSGGGYGGPGGSSPGTSGGTSAGSSGGPAGGPAGGTTAGGSSSGTSAGTSGGSSSGTSAGTSGGSSSGTSAGSSGGPSTGTATGTSGGSSAGSSAGTSAGASGGNSSGGSAGTPGGDCQGPHCGGCPTTETTCQDDTVNYGDCACAGSADGGPLY